jgi:hypothetical protein
LTRRGPPEGGTPSQTGRDAAWQLGRISLFGNRANKTSAAFVAQVSKPAVPQTSKSASGQQVWKPALQKMRCALAASRFEKIIEKSGRSENSLNFIYDITIKGCWPSAT